MRYVGRKMWWELHWYALHRSCMSKYSERRLWSVTDCMNPVRNSSAVGFLLVCDRNTPGLYSVCEWYGDSPLGAEGASINTVNPPAVVWNRINCLFHKNEHTVVAICGHFTSKMLYMEIKCQLDATEVFIADLIACSTRFGHHYALHQELKSIVQ